MKLTFTGRGLGPILVLQLSTCVAGKGAHCSESQPASEDTMETMKFTSSNRKVRFSTGWTPPPTDGFPGVLSYMSVPGDVYNPAPNLIMPNGEPPFDWY